MDNTTTIALRLVEPFVSPFLPHTRMFWLYFLVPLLVAYVVYRRGGARGPQARFLSYLLPRRIFLHRSALVDYRYFFVNYLSFLFLLAPLMLSGSAVAPFVERAWQTVLGSSPQWGAPGPAGLALYAVAVAVAFDLGIYVVHYALHRVPVLWEFHKVHHSAQVLTPISVYRVHPLDDILYGAATGALTGAVHGSLAYVAGAAVMPVTILHVDVVLFVFYVLGSNLRHSHVWLSYPAWLSRILISPAQHQIHHSAHPRHVDRNLGLMFAFWDAAMNTLYVPERHEELTFGLNGGGAEEYDGVLALYFLPFRKLLERWRVKWVART